MKNNRDRIAQLSKAGIPEVARIPSRCEPGPLNDAYLVTQARRSRTVQAS